MDAMAWGNKYEDVAISIYEHRNNKKILEFGCIRHPFIDFWVRHLMEYQKMELCWKLNVQLVEK